MIILAQGGALDRKPYRSYCDDPHWLQLIGSGLLGTHVVGEIPAVQVTGPLQIVPVQKTSQKP